MTFEPRCGNCGHMKIAHTVTLICPKMIWVPDRYDETKFRWKCVGYLETTYIPKK